MGVGDGENGQAPLAYLQAARGTERELVDGFAAVIRSRPHAVLAGHNIRGFDLPLILRKFEQYGLHDATRVLMQMGTNDTRVVFQKLFDRLIDPAFKGAVGIPEGQLLESGCRLYDAARAMGLQWDKSKSHDAAYVVAKTQELNDVLGRPDAAQRYDFHAHIEAHDSMKKHGVTDVSWHTVRRKAEQLCPDLLRTVTASSAPEIIRVCDLESPSWSVDIDDEAVEPQFDSEGPTPEQHAIAEEFGLNPEDIHVEDWTEGGGEDGWEHDP